MNTFCNSVIYQSKCEFRTSFPSRRDSRLIFPSIWTGKLDETVTVFTSDEFLVYDEFLVSNVNSATILKFYFSFSEVKDYTKVEIYLYLQSLGQFHFSFLMLGARNY